MHIPLNKRRVFGWTFVLSIAIQISCSTEPGSENKAPSWIAQPARTVDAGYIVYVTSGEDRSIVEATFKAKAAAVEDVANECSFAPKGTRVEDQYDQPKGILHHVYIKMALSFEDCQAAQNAIDPNAIKKLANVSLAQELKRYQDTVDLEARQDIQDLNESESSSQNDPLATASPVPHSPSNGPVYSSPSYVSYMVTRQQIAYAKETVIFAPAGSYPVNSPQSVQFTNTVAPAVRETNSYQASHPEVATWNHSWSSLPYKPAVPAFNGVSGMRSTVARFNFRRQSMGGAAQRYGSRRSQGGGQGGAQGGGRRHRRRGW
jgi:hypothetical protein